MKLILSLVFLSFNLHASIKLTLNSDLAIGSDLELKLKDKNQKVRGIFLGRMTDHSEFGDEIILFNTKIDQIQMIDTDNAVASFDYEKLQKVVSPYDQAGETCAAYAIFHYWLQTAEFGYKGNGTLEAAFKTERARLKFLEESITRYYLGRTSDIHNVMKSFATRHGFKCKERVFTDSRAAADYVFSRASIGKPVLMEFFIGPNMVTVPYRYSDLETEVILDDRLWVPRRVGERNSGGHAIVAIGAFDFKGKRKSVVLDSNWTEPRVWNLDDYLGAQTKIEEMIFHSCD